MIGLILSTQWCGRTCDHGSYFVHPVRVMPDKHRGGHVNWQCCLAKQVAHLSAQPLHFALSVASSLFCHHGKGPARHNAASFNTVMLS